MNLVAYAVYDAETGEVVHVHVERAELGTAPEEIVAIADVGQPGRLRAVRLPADDLSRGPGRVVDGALQADDGAGWGRAGTGSDGVEPAAERTYLAQYPERG